MLKKGKKMSINESHYNSKRPDKVKAIQELRRSSASGTHNKRTSRNEARRKAIKFSMEH